MTVLHTLRKSTALARWILLWWCMALGVAVASPWVQPAQHMQVCSASGSVSVQDTGAPDTPASHHLDCMLCLGTGAPPVAMALVPAADPAPPLRTGQAVSMGPQRRTAAPPPGRGPPRV